MTLATLDFFGSGSTPLILQSESVECGLACLAMVAGHHGHDIDLSTLRRRFPISAKGVTLQMLMQIARDLRLSARALRCEPEALESLPLPAMLHWDLNHFVVLSRVRRGVYEILDPARGRLRLDAREISRHFTGVVLELAPTPEFEPKAERARLSVWSLWKGSRGLARATAQILMLAAALEVFALAAPFLQQLVIDSAIVSADRDLLSVLAIGFGLLLLVQCAINAARSWALLYLGTTLNTQLVRRLFRHVMELPIDFFQKRTIGDVLSRFGSLDMLQRTMTTSFLSALIDGVMVAAMLVLMFIYSVKLALITLAAAAVYASLRAILFWPLRAASEEVLIRQAKQHTHFLESIRGVQSVKLFAREGLRQNAYENLLIERMNAEIRVQKMGVNFQTAQLLIFGLETIIVLYAAAHLVLDGLLTVGMLFAYMSYKLQFSQRSSALMDKYAELRMLNLHAERLADIALAPVDPASASQAPLVPASHAISVQGLTYRYSAHERPIFENLSFEVGEGEILAITGASGCGKTTLIKVLLGLLPPESGEMRVGGNPINAGNLRTYREMVGTVMQEDHLFAGSILDNITFFDAQADVDRAVSAARIAALHDDIVQMPMQYNTYIGDMGSSLSGGQRQRLILARALYKQPKILFLDEATSHVDVTMEHAINAHLRQLRVTIVMVAHRPETIRLARHVLAMEPGKGLRKVERTPEIVAIPA